jgi:lipopolysaccharide export system protein LptA
MDVLSLPGGSRTPADGDRSAAPAPPAAETPAAAPTPRKPPKAVATTKIAPAAATAPAAGAATAPAEEPEPLRRNVFLAVFSGNVRVDTAQGNLHGADRLKLRFEAGGELDEQLLEARQREIAAAGTPEPRSAAEAAEADGEPAGPRKPSRSPAETPDRSAGKTAADAAPSAPADVPSPAVEEPAEAAAPRPLVITWTGPLELAPTGRVEDPRRDRFEISASGERLVLWDRRATAQCRQFLYRNPDRAGYIRGDADEPARLLLEDGQEIACREIRFDRLRGEALLVGEGYMARREALPESGELGEDAFGRLNVVTEAPADRIRWSQRVLARFSTVTDASGERREALTEAEFHGEVLLETGGSDDRMDCSELAVTFGHDDRRDWLSRAIARGDVYARQGSSEILADAVTVEFAPPAEAAEDANDEGPREGFAFSSDAGEAEDVRPREILAEGDVMLIDRPDGSQEPRTVHAQRVRYWPEEGRAVLAGLPAVVRDGENEIAARRLILREAPDPEDADRTLRTVQSEGAGRIGFLTRRGLNGEKLPEARRIDVAWTGSMEYAGGSDRVKFLEGVSVVSGGDRLRCGELELVFTEPNAPADAPASPVAEASAERGGSAFDVEDYSRREIVRIAASGDVEVVSERLDERGRLLRKLELYGRRLIYEAAESRMDIFDAGELLIADYRPPEPDEVRSADAEAGPGAQTPGLQRPYQMAFGWEDLMSLRFGADASGDARREVTMTGDVWAVMVSGRHLVREEGLNVPEWPEQSDGRVGRLRCEQLSVAFFPPEDDAPTAAADETDPLTGGPRVGGLKQFVAEGDVNLIDGEQIRRQGVAERVTYDAGTDVVTLLGALPGQGARQAVLRTENRDTGRSEQVSASQILWLRKTDRIIAREVAGSGQR